MRRHSSVKSRAASPTGLKTVAHRASPVPLPLPAAFSAKALVSFRRALRAWYRRHARRLPWRQTADPYPIWISEIMLQQTTVAAVVPYFERFLARFPTVRSLADADEEEVLRLWEGLGYYSRARNIHRTARLIADGRGGVFPDSVAALEDLPGIGRYTAGAIVSFAFDRRAPIVEANTLRLYCRLLGFAGDPRSVEGQRRLWSFAETLVPARSPGQFNQGLMDLGATVCTPEQPLCERCPVRRWCAALAEGKQAEIPWNRGRPALTSVIEIAVAVERDGKYLMVKRPPGERWGGLWDFVRFPADDDRARSPSRGNRRCAPPHERRARANSRTGDVILARRVADISGVDVELGEFLTELRHGVTRYRITLRCYRARWRAGEPLASHCECRWVAPGQLRDLPLSTTGRKLARLLEQAR